MGFQQRAEGCFRSFVRLPPTPQFGEGMIEVQNLTKNYGDRRAIQEITFAAHQAEILGLLGPNGAGKTTTMRILAGFIPPTSGTVKICGIDIMEKSMEARRITGYLPETIPLYPDLTVFDYLVFMARLYGVKDTAIKAEQLLVSVNLINRASSLVGFLSKGLRQRLGLAQALINDPKVLILDEPTIGMDPNQIIEVRDLIRSISIEKTIVLSTHILSEAQQLCDRIIILNNGTIVIDEKTDRLDSWLSGVSNIHIKLNGSVDDACSLIASIPDIDQVRILSTQEIEVQIPFGIDPRTEISKKLIANGINLQEIYTASSSLEDVFIRLTSEDQKNNLPNDPRKHIRRRK
jgi:ABC-2 type transport system ATP-binding protein